MASVRETSVKGKHRTEVTEATEEELGLGVEGPRLKEKHRTEVTEEGIGVADESDLF